MIVVGGDAIVDLIDRGDRQFEACPGGSTLNCALAAGQLGSEVLYVSTLSTDAYGDLLLNRLHECGVMHRADARSHANSSLAIVSLDASQQPSYAFYRADTADREVPVDAIIAAFPDSLSIFHVGACALIPASDQDAWLAVAIEAQARGALISIDPNCRPSMTSDAVEYRAGIERFLKLADLIKLSDEDLAFLHPEWTEEPLQQFRQRYEPALGVYTAGERGITGWTAGGLETQVSASLPGMLVDTVGAGDSVQGTLIAEVDRLGLDRQGLAGLNSSDLHDLLTLAAQVAGVNCTRTGCQPPTRDEVMGIYGSYVG